MHIGLRIYDCENGYQSHERYQHEIDRLSRRQSQQNKFREVTISQPQNRRSRDQIDQQARVTKVFLDYAKGREKQTEDESGERADSAGGLGNKLSLVTRRLIHLAIAAELNFADRARALTQTSAISIRR